MKESQRQPIIFFIQKHISTKIIVRHKHQIIDMGHVCYSTNQYKAWSKSSINIQLLAKFLVSNRYVVHEPKYRHTNNYKTHELSWSIINNKYHKTMIDHWDSKNIPITIVKSNYNAYVHNIKRNCYV